MSFNAISDTIQRAFEAAGLNPEGPAWKAVQQSLNQALFQADPAEATPVKPTVGRTRVTGEASFLEARYSGPAGARDYRLFMPSSYRGRAMPLIMMLHGCQQTPEDFAVGTRMNALAEQHGLLVVYPAQSSNANGSNCWNWYQVRDQARDGGEPEILVGIVQDVRARCAVDPRRVFVAGLSAGAAMAVILGTTHPDLFAAVGVHSGLPFGAAHDVGSAFAVMQGAGQGGDTPEAPNAGTGVPTIVFHGDEDRTVVDANADLIVRRAVAGFESGGRRLVRSQTVRPAGTATRAYTSTVHAARDGRPLVAHWQIKGGTHAWSGGDPAGSFTDPTGPDASAEMLRFFLHR